MNNNLKLHIRTQARNNFFINLVLNGVIAWFLLRGTPAFGAWGEHGYGPDLIITGFLLSLLLTVIIAKIHRAQLAKGQHQALSGAALGVIARAAPRNDWVGGIVFGIGGVLVALVTVGVLELMPLPPFEPLGYALFKGVWAGVLSVVLVPPAIRIGLRTAS